MLNTWLQLCALWLSISSTTFASVTQANPLQISVQKDQLMVDGQIYLGMTPTIESALKHGIAIIYHIDIELRDPDRRFWQNPLHRKRTRVKLSYDSLKQTYLLTNLTLQRFESDRDLNRALMTLGAIQSLPLVNIAQLKTQHPYEIRLRVQLDHDSLPNALRLSSLIDREWQVDMSWQTQSWQLIP